MKLVLLIIAVLIEVTIAQDHPSVAAEKIYSDNNLATPKECYYKCDAKINYQDLYLESNSDRSCVFYCLCKKHDICHEVQY